MRHPPNTHTNPRIAYQLAHRSRWDADTGGKPLIVHFVVNVEHWPFDRPMPRKILTPPHAAQQVPDVPNYCWMEYGMRVGMSRMLTFFQDRGLPVSASINAGVVSAYPECAEAILEAGWEFVGHGTHQQSIQSAGNERELIDEALHTLRRFSGQPVRGWLSPGLNETMDTPDLLKDAGVEYLFDWCLDDVPCWMETAHGRMIAMPYSLELNDSVIYAVERHRSNEMLLRLQSTLECFDTERAGGRPLVLGIGLHPHLMGVPHRFVYLQRMVELLMARGDVAFMTGAGIADWFTARSLEEAVPCALS